MNAGKVLAMLALIIVGLAALGVTACGGFVTVMGIAGGLSAGQLTGMGGVMTLSVGSLVLGSLVCYFCFKGISKLNAKAAQPGLSASAQPAKPLPPAQQGHENND